uniref:Uncharacterized protein n=1 Tax=Rhizophora mucronata TaxID=61149 RepID=A0A2P2R3C6_RHIMU
MLLLLSSSISHYCLPTLLHSL